MAQTNFTPISLYYSTTASAAPTAGNLVNGELAINIRDGKLFYKDNAGVVQTIASKGTGSIGGSTTQVQYNSSGAFAGSANMTFDGTNLTLLGSLGIGASVGSNVKVAISGTLPTASNLSYSFRSLGTIPSATTTAAWGFDSALATEAAAFTLAELFNYRATQGAIGATSAVTTQYGFAVTSGMAGATNNYGFHGNLAAATGRYNLYMAGTANNYLAGSLAIGQTGSVTGQTFLRVDGTNLTNANPIVIDSQTTAPATATGSLNIFRSVVATAASAFTLPLIQHFATVQGTIGATSAVTSQYGFTAAASLTGATTNLGFYGAIAAGTGRFNLYMAGTAANYFGGDMQFNKTVTAAGTTGAQTISKNAGTVNFAAAATSLVVTNTLVTANSIIICTVGTNDTTMKSASAVAAAGSFTIFSNAAATAETRVNFIVIN
jgi:hypothetical protein